MREAQVMANAQDAIEETVLEWPAEKRMQLAEKLLASVEDFASPAVAAAWNAEIEARVKEIREGRAEGIPAESVMAEARRQLEVRRLSPARRR